MVDWKLEKTTVGLTRRRGGRQEGPAGPKKERPSRGICLRSSERDERIRHDDADGDVIDLSG